MGGWQAADGRNRNPRHTREREHKTQTCDEKKRVVQSSASRGAVGGKKKMDEAELRVDCPSDPARPRSNEARKVEWPHSRKKVKLFANNLLIVCSYNFRKTQNMSAEPSRPTPCCPLLQLTPQNLGPAVGPSSGRTPCCLSGARQCTLHESRVHA